MTDTGTCRMVKAIDVQLGGRVNRLGLVGWLVRGRSLAPGGQHVRFLLYHEDYPGYTTRLVVGIDQEIEVAS